VIISDNQVVVKLVALVKSGGDGKNNLQWKDTKFNHAQKITSLVFVLLKKWIDTSRFDVRTCLTEVSVKGAHSTPTHKDFLMSIPHQSNPLLTIVRVVRSTREPKDDTLIPRAYTTSSTR
jgi:hypothetical protein